MTTIETDDVSRSLSPQTKLNRHDRYSCEKYAQFLLVFSGLFYTTKAK